MSETIADRIQQRLDALGISQREAAARAGVPASTLRNVLGGTSQSPRGNTLTKLAAALHTTERWLLIGAENAASIPIASETATLPNEVRGPVDGVDPALLANLPKDVPVLGTVAGSELGKGAFHLTGDAVDYVRRPYGLLGAKDIYALFVEGESMIPKFEPGDLVFVHPHRKPRGGDYVVIQEPDTDNGEPRGFIKRLVTITGKELRTEQFNPPSKITFVLRPGLVVHKVMSDGELYGI